MTDDSPPPASRAYFVLCSAAGRVLRAARYSTVHIVHQDGRRLVRKRRRFYAPFLIWMSGPLVRILDAGVRVLPQRDWEERERQIYQRLYGASIQVEAHGALVLPVLAGQTLATLLEDPALDDTIRQKAIEAAAIALARFHRLELTHGDAMAENVLVDLETGVARWFDFETIHEEGRSLTWRRADDLRALLVTCVVRTASEKRGETVARILESYADENVTRVLAACIGSVWQRPLALHLLQARLSFQCFRQLGRLLQGRSPGGAATR